MIPFIDLKAQYHSIKPEIDAVVSAVLESGHFAQGPQVAALEKEFAAFSETSEGIAVNSGTSALHLALLAAGIGAGDEVITVPFTFVATVAAIGYVGARTAFVDVDPETLNIDVDQIERAITSRTKAIVPVHLYGQPADMDPIMEIARKHGLVVIEDAAQAHGAAYKARKAGSIGHLACFSFYPAKNMGAFGEGGMVTTSDATFAKMIRSLRDWGQEGRYNHVLKGFNFRMDEMQGAILRVKLQHLPEWNEARRRIARRYDSLLCGTVRKPATAEHVTHVHHLYPIRSRDRSALQRALSARGIQTGLHYPVPVHLQPAYADLGYSAGDFPESELAAGEVLSLPLYPEMTDESVAAVADAVRESYDG